MADPCRASEGTLLASKHIKEPPPWAEGKTRLQALCDGLSAAVSYRGAEPPARAARGASPVMSPGCVNQTRQASLGQQVSQRDGSALCLAALAEEQHGEGCSFVPGAPKGMQSTEHPSLPPPLSPCPRQPWGSWGWQWEPVLEGHQSGDAPNCCKQRRATVCPNCCPQTIKYHVMS